MVKSFQTDQIGWDKTNIGENYPGVTLPLTYSFIRDAYAHVYRNFLKVIGMPENVLRHHREVMDNLLGYVKGHVFYNIENWYGMIKLLPGYRYNKTFFEAMLDPVQKKEKANNQEKSPLNFWGNVKVAVKFILSVLFFTRLHQRFEERFTQISNGYKRLKLWQLTSFELVSAFETLEEKFFSLWAITIINDFRVMITFGLLKRLAERVGEKSQEILRRIQMAKSVPRSIMPLKEIVALAKTVRSNRRYQKLFRKDSREILKDLERNEYRTLNRLIRRYLKEYGERAMNELKLEDEKFKDNPESFLVLVKYYVRLDKQAFSVLAARGQKKEGWYIPKGCSLIERLLLKILIPVTVEGIYLREFYRMRRAKAFTMAREIFLEIGKRMHTVGDLTDVNDIFYLYKNEVFDYIRYHRLKNGFTATVQARKTLLERYKNEQMARRVTTYGLPSEERVESDYPKVTSTLTGMGTANGRTKGEVIIMKNLDLSIDCRGKILVTEATDPGWTVVFPLVKGVVTEQGGLLSHASIIARELGIPCIVRVSNATRLLKTGCMVEMDAARGTVTVIYPS